MALPVPQAESIVNWVLLASAARTTSSNSDPWQVDYYNAAEILLDVTALTGTSSTLDVYIQRLRPDDTTWDAIAQFTQITTSTSAQELDFVTGGNLLHSTTSIAAGTIRTVNFGSNWRILWEVGGSQTTATFAVYGNFRKRAA